ncbi:hypothetical protein SAMN02983003_2951 [Devosia enhydra]|uniref:Uncharacterized protein n=1 Tax=Devosia enhydra TaxID=665118 RepID=A0A1K2I062_9HYPH|nr:hypothetical protein [Devosia enhydra]SFZ85781.1 hypothetical protein SAMN02983003_2951 [Devosia enhydra]
MSTAPPTDDGAIRPDPAAETPRPVAQAAEPAEAGGDAAPAEPAAPRFALPPFRRPNLPPLPRPSLPPGLMPAIGGGVSRVASEAGGAILAIGRRFDLVLPVLATAVGLIALGGAVIVDRAGQARDDRLRAEIAELRTALELSSKIIIGNVPVAAEQAARGAISADLEAANARLAAIETEMGGLAETIANLPPPGTAVAMAGDGGAGLDGPTEDCIPLQTRFMVTAGDSYPICRTPVVVDVVDVTGDSVILEGVEPIYSGGFTRLGVANCTAMVFTAGIEGFAEMRVAC